LPSFLVWHLAGSIGFLLLHDLLSLGAKEAGLVLVVPVVLASAGVDGAGKKVGSEKINARWHKESLVCQKGSPGNERHERCRS
jgi:hypothetical protein